MRRSSLVAALIAFLALTLPSAVRGQSFGPPLVNEVLYQLQDREGNPRVTVAAYMAQWQNPFKFKVTTELLYLPPADDGRIPTLSTTFRLVADTPASPLFETTYRLGKRWSLGFWYNPIRGEHLQEQRLVAEQLKQLDLDKDTDLADLHLTYYGSRGLAAQIGYYRDHGIIHSQRLPPRRTDYTLTSWNLWLTQHLEVRARCYLLTPFVSVGYHPSGSLDHAVSLLAGLAVSLNERLSLSASLWKFDLADPATRITGGLVVRL
jgi:hypothetical protein